MASKEAHKKQVQEDRERLSTIIGSSAIYAIKRGIGSYDFYYMDDDYVLVPCNDLLCLAVQGSYHSNNQPIFLGVTSPNTFVSNAAIAVGETAYRLQVV
jgi:hypothetical protein